MTKKRPIPPWDPYSRPEFLETRFLTLGKFITRKPQPTKDSTVSTEEEEVRRSSELLSAECELEEQMQEAVKLEKLLEEARAHIRVTEARLWKMKQRSEQNEKGGQKTIKEKLMDLKEPQEEKEEVEVTEDGEEFEEGEVTVDREELEKGKVEELEEEFVIIDHS